MCYNKSINERQKASNCFKIVMEVISELRKRENEKMN